MTVLMSVATLNARMNSGASTVVLDVRWALGDPHGHDHYLAEHIPGAVYVDMDTELAAHGLPAEGRHPLPAEADFAASVRRWGINAQDTVVVYDDAGSASAARAWWLLGYAGLPEIYLLDGGLAAWRAARLPLADGEEAAVPGDAVVRFGMKGTIDSDGAAGWDGVLLDARAGERYRGEVEPMDPKAGHIPGAVSAPTSENLAADKTFLPAEQLRARFTALGVDTDTAVAVYCGSGVTAAHQIAALEIAGFKAVLYPGSWSAWSNQPGRPVETGANGDMLNGMTEVKAYAANSATSGFAPSTVKRREPGAHDVEISIEFCGLCHSDVHAIRSEWGPAKYPLVPGHEIVGTVSRIGDAVEGFNVGQRVGVGCLVDSCRECDSCLEGFEQYCEGGNIGTYGVVDRRNGGGITQGGYSKGIVVDENYVLRIPDGMDPAAAAPLLCAGVTTYSPLSYLDVQEGDKVGVVGLGGLGHMAVKIAKALGATVTVFTTSPDKEVAAKELGADAVVVSTDPAQMAAVKGSLNAILDTVAAVHDINAYLRTLDRDGALIQLGLPPTDMPPVDPGLLIRKRLAYGGSLIGGIAETQEMLDFCAEHGIVSDIEMVTAADLDNAYDRMVAGDVRYRFVLDNSTI